MGIIEDAYQFGLEFALTKTRGYGIHSIIDNLSRGQAIASELTPKFFEDYREYPYNKTNADIVFQAIYFAVMDRIADQLKYNIKQEYTKFRAEIFASGLFGEFTGEHGTVRRTVESRGTPLEKLMQNFSISTGRKPDAYAISQLEYIVDLGDRIAREHGATKNNINWADLNLYLQPGMDKISPGHITEIREDLEELFTEPTIREELKDAKAIFNDHRYNIILAWFGGSQINVYYNGKEINVIGLGGVPANKQQAEIAMEETTKEPDYPEFLANDQETYKEFQKLSGH